MEQAMSNKNVTLGKGWSADTKIVKVTTSHLYQKVEGTEVCETTNYDLFKRDIKNRPLTEEKVHLFMKEFEKGKLFMMEFPVIVDKDYLILDGQHRFEALRRLEFSILFRFATNLTIHNVIDVQVNAGWSTRDYLHAYIKQKKMDYIILSRFLEKYKLSFTIAISILNDSLGGIKRSGFYEGAFKVKDEDKAHKIAAAIFEVGLRCKGLHRDKSFCMAFLKAFKHEEYEHKRMIDQLEKYASLVVRQVTTDAYLKNFEEVYNYKLFTKNKIRFS